MLIPTTKKRFKTGLIVAEFLVIFCLIAGFVVLTNLYNRSKATPEMKAELTEWQRVSRATEKLVSPELWASAKNEGLLIANTVEDGVVMSIYTQYQTDEGRVESLVTSGSVDKTYNKTVRAIYAEKFSNAFATTSVASLLKDDNPVVTAAILCWQRDGETYSLVDINGDGSWDYVTKGEESHFSKEEGDLTYTDDIGEKTFVTASESVEIFSPHLSLKEAEKFFSEL